MKYGVLEKRRCWEWDSDSYTEPEMYIFVFNNVWKRISVLIFHNAIWQILKADDVFREDSSLILEVRREETLHQPFAVNCVIIHILL